MAKGSKHARQRFRKWINSYPDVSAWLEKYGDLEQQLDDNGGLLKIENFLPTFVAEGILEMLRGIDDKTWNLTAAGDDYVHNNIRHEFLSVKQGPPGLQDVFRIFTLLLPDSLFTFSAAKYCKAGHIVPHDDRAYTQVLMDDGSMQLCSRTIACIYYLTHGWSEADGGHLVDLEAPGGPQQHLPAFNSVVAFRIPRWHEVKPVTGDRPRYSIFGWFLEPGKLYELNTGEEAPPQQHSEAVHGAAEPEQQQQHAAAAVKQKRKKQRESVQKPQQQAAKPVSHASAGVKKKRRQRGVPPLSNSTSEQQQQQQQQRGKQKRKQPSEPVPSGRSAGQAAVAMKRMAKA
uniref:Fe2OG dioxygenase domain-containing protein n=1 Tax=Tetradesmus obliquus TaxID=3088 RepID=A0A383W562_TETOB|eukprot:jgi/Sobl393_1/14746/SZX71796.1